MAGQLVSYFFLVIFSNYLSLIAADKWTKYETPHDEDKQWSFKSFYRQLGIQKLAEDVSSKMVDCWNKAASYNNFERDLANLKAEPLNPIVLASFISNTTLPGIYVLSMHVKNGWIIIYKMVMGFTKEKCDKFMGPEAPMHPWNVVRQNKETVSFAVFIYAIGVSTILLKLCSFLNFIGLIAAGYTAYVFGGPYLCFQGFVFITGFCWLLFDTVLMYPLQTAIIFLIVYFWASILSYINGFGKPKRQDSEYKNLKDKIERLEIRADVLKERLIRLQELLDLQENKLN